MQNFSMLIQGFGTALTPMNIGVCMLGAVLGLIGWAQCQALVLWPVLHCFCR